MISIIPEIFLLVMSCVTLLSGLFSRKDNQLVYYLAQITLLITASLSIFAYKALKFEKIIFLFHQSFIVDNFAVLMKVFICIIVFFVLIYAKNYNDERKIPATEFYALSLLSTLGMLTLVSAHNFITLFLSIELMSLPTYAMVAMRRDNVRCIEAALKYFVMGAIASALLLYGISMVFGATQQLDFSLIAQIVAGINPHENLMLVLGLIFIVGAIAFKMGAAPFHMWVPDVYEGAPTSVTLFIASAPKVAVFAMIIRILVEAMPTLHIQWQEILIVISVLSMLVGNFAAIVQSNIKRMLAYSSIAHMGYMLLGICSATPLGYGAALFYMMTYVLMTLAAFGMIIVMSKLGFEAENVQDFSGLNYRNPWLAFMMMLVMFSLAGVPPLVGFIAKVGVLESLIRVHLVWLVVVALLFAIIGAYYYLRVVKVMYFEEPQIKERIHCTRTVKAVVSITSLTAFFIGIFPGWLFLLVRAVF